MKILKKNKLKPVLVMYFENICIVACNIFSHKIKELPCILNGVGIAVSALSYEK